MNVTEGAVLKYKSLIIFCLKKYCSTTSSKILARLEEEINELEEKIDNKNKKKSAKQSWEERVATEYAGWFFGGREKG